MRFAVLALLAAACGQEEKIYTNSYKGKAPPELEIKKENWINAKEAPRLADLKGRVVWLEFSFLG